MVDKLYKLLDYISYFIEENGNHIQIHILHII